MATLKTNSQVIAQAVKYLCAQGTTLEAIDYALIRVKSETIANNLILLRSQLKPLLDRFSLGLIDNNEYNISSNKVTYACLQLMDSIEEHDLKETNDFSEEPKLGGYETDILVICLSNDQKMELEIFFRNFHFRNVICITASDWEEVDIELKKANKDRAPKFTPLITIFDNRHLSHCPDREALSDLSTPEQVDISSQIDFMKSCIRKELSPYYLHYGEAFYFLNLDNNRDLIHAANSRFALIARTKELLDYIAAYRNEKPISDSPHHLSDDAMKMG